VRLFVPNYRIKLWLVGSQIAVAIWAIVTGLLQTVNETGNATAAPTPMVMAHEDLLNSSIIINIDYPTKHMSSPSSQAVAPGLMLVAVVIWQPQVGQVMFCGLGPTLGWL